MTATFEAVEKAIEGRIYTVAEYFELEKHSEIRYEYHYGKLIAMPEESKQANRIAGNCEYAFRIHLKSKGYFTYRHDVRTIVKDGNIYRYPDLVVAPKSDSSDTHAVTKPEMLVEVTSVNSEKTDHESKMREYLSLPTVQHYIIVSQKEMLVEVYSRDKRGWHFDILTEPTDFIEIKLLDAQCTLSLSDIYEDVDFSILSDDIPSEA